MYVGQTVQKFKKRIAGHKRQAFKSKSQLPLHRAMRKYGIDNFIFEIIEECDSIESLNAAEAMWILKLDTFGDSGYNCTTGGEGFIVSEETKKKISISKTGSKLSEEHCRAISAATAGEHNPFYGKTHSVDTIDKIKETLKGQMDGEKNPFFGKHHSDDSIKKISEKNKINQTGRKAGTKHHNVKLNEDNVLEIRRLASEGKSHLELSMIFKVERGTITKIINRQRWKHI